MVADSWQWLRMATNGISRGGGGPPRPGAARRLTGQTSAKFVAVRSRLGRVQKEDLVFADTEIVSEGCKRVITSWAAVVVESFLAFRQQLGRYRIDFNKADQ
jgi:hypothetical protein